MSRKILKPDGRSTRWEPHRTERREELVLAAVAAINLLGPQASIGEIAKAAEISRPVLYRYFQDKEDLHFAVGEWGAGLVLEAIIAPILADISIRDRIEAAVSAYLDLISQHTNVFLLLVSKTNTGDPLEKGKATISLTLGRFLGDGMRQLKMDAGGAEPWAQAIVGMGINVGTWWLLRQTMTQQAAAKYLSDFIWHAFNGIAAESGVNLEKQLRKLKMVSDA